MLFREGWVPREDVDGDDHSTMLLDLVRTPGQRVMSSIHRTGTVPGGRSIGQVARELRHPIETLRFDDRSRPLENVRAFLGALNLRPLPAAVVAEVTELVGYSPERRP